MSSRACRISRRNLQQAPTRFQRVATEGVCDLWIFDALHILRHSQAHHPFQQSAKATLTRALETLESGWLAQSRFLIGDSVTIADLAAYIEIGQLTSIRLLLTRCVVR